MVILAVLFLKMCPLNVIFVSYPSHKLYSCNMENKIKIIPTVKIGPFVAPDNHFLLVGFGIGCPD